MTTDLLPIHFSGPIRQGMIDAQRARHERLFQSAPAKPLPVRRAEPLPAPVAPAIVAAPPTQPRATAAEIAAWGFYPPAAPYDHCQPTSGLSSRTIIDEVCKVHRVTYAAITGPSRAHPIVVARHEAFHRLREERQLTWQEIGNLFGGRDHSTAMLGYRKHADRLLRKSMEGNL